MIKFQNVDEIIKFDREVFEKLRTIFDEINANVPSDKEVKETLKKIEKLADTGWLLPGYETSDDHWKFLNNIDNIDKLNDLFMEYFQRDNNFQRTIDKFNEERNVTKFKDLYNQAIYLYNNHMYAGALIILTTIYEGLIREQINYIDSSNVTGNINRYLNNRYTNKKTIVFQDRQGIKRFTENFFAEVDFKVIDDCNYFNRHVILHGVEYNKISKVDVLKMLNAIDVLDGLICDYSMFLEGKNE